MSVHDRHVCITFHRVSDQEWIQPHCGETTYKLADDSYLRSPPFHFELALSVIYIANTMKIMVYTLTSLYPDSPEPGISVYRAPLEQVAKFF